MLNGQLEQSATSNIATASPNETLFAVKPSEVEMKLLLQDRYCNLSTEDKLKVDKIIQTIEYFYDQIPTTLKRWPEIQRQCLSDLREAEAILSAHPLQQKDIIEGRFVVAKVRVELDKAQANINTEVMATQITVVGVAVILFVFLLLGQQAYRHGLLSISAAQLNESLFLGIPLPVWGWSLIGNLTSILLRASQLSGLSLLGAARWILLRLITGSVMGVLTYLMLVAGLIIFANNPQPKTPELIWIIAFVGSFSDTLSINLLQKILGQFSHDENSSQVEDKRQLATPYLNGQNR